MALSSPTIRSSWCLDHSRGASRPLALGSSGWRPPTRISTGHQCGPPFLALAAVLCFLAPTGPADAPGRSAPGPDRAWSLLIGMGADRLCKTFGPCELFGSKRIALHFVRKMQNVWAKRFASKTFVEMSNVNWPFSTQSRTKCTKHFVRVRDIECKLWPKP